jgi:hypothetical protein
MKDKAPPIVLLPGWALDKARLLTTLFMKVEGSKELDCIKL